MECNSCDRQHDAYIIGEWIIGELMWSGYLDILICMFVRRGGVEHAVINSIIVFIIFIYSIYNLIIFIFI